MIGAVDPVWDLRGRDRDERSGGDTFECPSHRHGSSKPRIVRDEIDLFDQSVWRVHGHEPNLNDVRVRLRLAGRCGAVIGKHHPIATTWLGIEPLKGSRHSRRWKKDRPGVDIDESSENVHWRSAHDGATNVGMSHVPQPTFCQSARGAHPRGFWGCERHSHHEPPPSGPQSVRAGGAVLIFFVRPLRLGPEVALPEFRHHGTDLDRVRVSAGEALRAASFRLRDGLSHPPAWASMRAYSAWVVLFSCWQTRPPAPSRGSPRFPR